MSDEKKSVTGDAKQPQLSAHGSAVASAGASRGAPVMSATPPHHAPSTAVPGTGHAASDRKQPLGGAAPMTGVTATGSASASAVASATTSSGGDGAVPMDTSGGSGLSASGNLLPGSDRLGGGMRMFGAGASDGKYVGFGEYKKQTEERDRKYGEERAREEAQRRDDEKALAAVRRTLRPFYQFQWLDVRDTQGDWLEANIVKFEDRDGVACAHIHYKGWKDKYDEWLPLREINDENHTTSQRLAPYLSKYRPETPKTGNVIPRAGLQIDIQDTTDKWLSGDIVEVRQFRDGPMIKVRYTGWEPKYDEWLNAETYRVAPLRTFTRAERPAPMREVNPQLQALRNAMDNESKFRLLLEAKMGCTIVVQAGDGNCMFRSVAHQVYGNPEYHFTVRQKCMEYMRSERDFYSQFVDGDFHMYIERMRLDGEWGDHTELQALSEIYQRPIRVYAYSTDPYWDYKGMFEANPPMLLSYHFQSHYNSIQPLDPERWTKPQLQSQPGEWEDEQIARSRARGGRLARPGDDFKAGSSSGGSAGSAAVGSATAQEAAQLQRALELSRSEFNARDHSQWESGAAGALRNFQGTADKMLEDAKKASEADFVQKQILDAALQKSDDEFMAKAKAASLAAAGGDMDPTVRAALAASLADAKAAGHAPQDDLARAMAASLASASGGGGGVAAMDAEMQKVMEMSRLDHERQQNQNSDAQLRAALAASSAADQKAGGGGGGGGAAAAADVEAEVVTACLEMGFSMDEAANAFRIMYDPNVARDMLQQNVLGYLLSKRA